MRTYDNGIYRDMTPEEIRELEKLQAETPAQEESPLEARVLALEVKSGIIRSIPAVFTPADAFAKGERGIWEGTVYTSLIDTNVWTPAQAPNLWTK